MSDNDELLHRAGDGHDSAVLVREEPDLAARVAAHHTEDHAVGLGPLRRVDRGDAHVAVIRAHRQPCLRVSAKDANLRKLVVEPGARSDLKKTTMAQHCSAPFSVISRIQRARKIAVNSLRCPLEDWPLVHCF